MGKNENKPKKKAGFDMTTVRRLLEYIKPYWAYVVLSLLFTAVNILFMLFIPVVIGDGIDCIIDVGRVDFAALKPVLFQLVFIITGASVFGWLAAYFTNIITYRPVRDLRIKYFDVLNRVPVGYIDRTPHGDLTNRAVNDMDMVSEGLLHGFTQLFSGVFTVVGTLILMLCENISITLLVVIMTPISLFVAGFIAKGSYKYFSSQTVVQSELSAYAKEMIENQSIVSSFGYEERAEKRFGNINSELYNVGKNAQFYSALTNPCTRFVNNLVYAAVGITGAIAAVNGRLTVGQISMFLSYANQYTKPFNEISGITAQLQSAIASAARIFKVLDEKSEDQENDICQNQAIIDSASIKGNVGFDNVCFSYVPERKLIEDFSLTVKPGMRVAIVGPTGCGKTTLINLLMRFYDVTGGGISVDGRDIRELDRDSLRRGFGMVLQDTWLFSGTIRENIAFGNPGATDEEIENAAKSAHAHGFISRLPDGYDTVISGSGGNLSQGQKQLLCIARVMLLDPPMLILDEATSNIDTRTEIAVQRAFAEMMHGHTSFIVAHRLSTIKNADLILAMDKGRILETGTHDQLIEKNGFYAGLYRSMVL